MEWELLVFGALSTGPQAPPLIIWRLEWELLVFGEWRRSSLLGRCHQVLQNKGVARFWWKCCGRQWAAGRSRVGWGRTTPGVQNTVLRGCLSVRACACAALLMQDIVEINATHAHLWRNGRETEGAGDGWRGGVIWSGNCWCLVQVGRSDTRHALVLEFMSLLFTVGQVSPMCLLMQVSLVGHSPLAEKCACLRV